MQLPRSTDFLIIGGGVIGLNLALRAKERHPQASVTLLEKEPYCGAHASGRNSGVLHAGFYYDSDSLKARLTREGNRRMADYCLDRGLAIRRCGKLVVARDEADLPAMEELERRAKKNGVELQRITPGEARELEPRITTGLPVLYSPTTATVDPRQVMASLADEARQRGIAIVLAAAYLGRDGGGVRTSRGKIAAGYVINAAGLYADRVARHYGFGERYRILPFKGLYLYTEAKAPPLNRHVYPVPDLERPFLGVHHTVTVTGASKIGPTAIPCFWREHYRGLERFHADELLEVVSLEASLLLRNDFHFRELALEELRKYRRPAVVRLASQLVGGVELRHYREWGRPGIRAQLLDKVERRLVMDFRLEGDGQSFHVLNAVSPAFTCSIPFTEMAFDRIDHCLNHGALPCSR